jgi:hypothetical protein
MQYATTWALKAVDDFTKDPDARAALFMYLSEVPIGDEYSLLNEEDRQLGQRFERWCGQCGIIVFA